MNIGLFTDTYYPEINGVANSVYLLKQELELKGHNVYVITTTTPGAPENEKNVYRVPSISCTFVPERRIGLFYQPLLAKKIRHMKLDVIHTHTEFSIGVFGRIMAKELFLPVVHTYHTIYEDYTHYIKNYISNENRARKLARNFSRISVRSVEEIIVPTKKVQELLSSYGVPGEITVIPTGIDLARFGGDDTEEVRQDYRNRLGLSASDKVILYLGRVSQEKNIDEVMRYLDTFFEKHKDARFVIVGDGEYRSDVLEPMRETLRHGDQIIFAGARPWDEITHYYQMADVFVSASTSETQGLTYIEALASGLPVVAREDECLDGVITQGENGFTYRTEETFLSSLEEVLYNNIMSTDRVDFASNARASVLKFSTKTFADKVENIYYLVDHSHKTLLEKFADKLGYDANEIIPIPSKMGMYLGESDMDVSRIALGCMRMATLSDTEVARVVTTALDEGITLFDHADIYGAGASEEKFGRLLSENRGMRDKMRIQTKCGICNGYYDLSAKHILESVEQSLRRLHTDYIDILLLHRPDALMIPDEIADALNVLYSAGKVLGFGVSNFNSMQLSMLQTAMTQPILVDQMQFGLGHTGMITNSICANTNLDGSADRDGMILDYCRTRDITIQAWSPLQYGMFEGSIFDKNRFPKLNEVLSAYARRYDVTEAVIAIAWILKHPAGMQVLIGSMNPDHIKDLCQADKIELTRQEWYELYTAAGNDLP